MKHLNTEQIKPWLWKRFLQSICIFLLRALRECSNSCCMRWLIEHGWRLQRFRCIHRTWHPWNKSWVREPIFLICEFVFIDRGLGEGYLFAFLCGQKIFNVGSSPDSITEYCEAITFELFNRKILLVDTPGSHLLKPL